MKIKLVFYSIFILVIISLGFRPANNWDMIGYIACVINSDEPDPKRLHEATYQLVENEVSEKKYQKLISGDYKGPMRYDSKAFNEQLPFYSIKILYVSVIKFFYRFGIPITLSTVLPSLISTLILICLVFYFIEHEIGNPVFSGIASLIILFFPATLTIARFSTPDGLSTLLLFITALLYIKRKNSIVFFIFMTLSIATRTDNIIWCFILICADSFLRQNGPYDLVRNAMLALSIVATLIIITHYFGNRGWQILFYHSFIEKMNYPLTTDVTFSLKQYLAVLFGSSWFFMPWFLACATLIYLFWNKSNKQYLSNKSVIVILTCILTFTIRFFLFPATSGRFYIALLIISLVAAIIERKLFQSLVKEGLKRAI